MKNEKCKADKTNDTMNERLLRRLDLSTAKAENARELLPTRFPYVYEFENALKLDPRNTGLRREFGFLLLRMKEEKRAEEQFRIVTSQAPGDLLAATEAVLAVATVRIARGRETSRPAP